jgi:hypothetical protein
VVRPRRTEPPFRGAGILESVVQHFISPWISFATSKRKADVASTVFENVHVISSAFLTSTPPVEVLEECLRMRPFTARQFWASC